MGSARGLGLVSSAAWARARTQQVAASRRLWPSSPGHAGSREGSFAAPARIAATCCSPTHPLDLGAAGAAVRARGKHRGAPMDRCVSGGRLAPKPIPLWTSRRGAWEALHPAAPAVPLLAPSSRRRCSRSRRLRRRRGSWPSASGLRTHGRPLPAIGWCLAQGIKSWRCASAPRTRSGLGRTAGAWRRSASVCSRLQRSTCSTKATVRTHASHRTCFRRSAQGARVGPWPATKADRHVG